MQLWTAARLAAYALVVAVVAGCGDAVVTHGPSAAIPSPTISPTTVAPSAPPATALPTQTAKPASGWIPTGSMHVARREHSATLLADGRVLAVGGADSAWRSLDTAEIFDPSTGSWTDVGSLSIARADHSAVLLADGRVLVAGGKTNETGANEIAFKAELFDPATGKWSSAGTAIGRIYGLDSGVLLPDGSVLFHAVVGEGSELTSIFERFDPTNLSWKQTAKLPEARIRPGLVVLDDGRVLVAGGSFARAELPYPVPEAWTLDRTGKNLRTLPDIPLDVGWSMASIGLSDGTVLLSGPAGSVMFDPATNSWHATSTASFWRDGQVASLLPDGRVVFAGSTSCHDGDRSSEIYDPRTDRWAVLGAIYPFSAVTMTTLAGGGVLLAGGGLPCDTENDNYYGPFSATFLLDASGLP
jgi:hypothetical protein